jgi:hypothetical protein
MESALSCTCDTVDCEAQWQKIWADLSIGKMGKISRSKPSKLGCLELPSRNRTQVGSLEQKITQLPGRGTRLLTDGLPTYSGNTYQYNPSSGSSCTVGLSHQSPDVRENHYWHPRRIEKKASKRALCTFIRLT